MAAKGKERRGDSRVRAVHVDRCERATARFTDTVSHRAPRFFVNDKSIRHLWRVAHTAPLLSVPTLGECAGNNSQFTGISTIHTVPFGTSSHTHMLGLFGLFKWRAKTCRVFSC